jgi:signal transduction histidine kinase
VARHAGATRVDVQLMHEADRVRLVVEDNGAGLGGEKPSAAKEAAGIGLVGMQERLDLFGGGLRIETGEAGGVRLSAYLPSPEKA